MNRDFRAPCAFVRGVPRTRGDEPDAAMRLLAHTRGMNRAALDGRPANRRVPRTRGDEPALSAGLLTANSSSPHTRALDAWAQPAPRVHAGRPRRGVSPRACVTAAHGLDLEAEAPQQSQYFAGGEPSESRHQVAVVSKLMDRRGFATNPKEAESSSLKNSPTASRRLHKVPSRESPWVVTTATSRHSATYAPSLSEMTV